MYIIQEIQEPLHFACINYTTVVVIIYGIRLVLSCQIQDYLSLYYKSAIDIKRPPRGPIPKVTPKIPDSPGTLTIEWEESLQKAGLILTEKLRDYWKERARRLETEYSPVLTNLKSLTNQDQWSTIEDILEQIARETQQELKRKKPKQQAAPTSNNKTNQAKRNIRTAGTRSPTSQ